MKEAFLKELFGFERPETEGERRFFNLFELAALAWTLYFVWNWSIYIQSTRMVILPLGIAMHLDIQFMLGSWVAMLNAALITVALVLGRWKQSGYAYLMALILFHFQYTARFCLGEISHGSNIVGTVLAGLAVGALGFKERKNYARFSLGFCWLFIGMGYASASLCKMVATGPSWISGAHLWLWIGERTVDTLSITGGIEYNLLQSYTLGSYALATAILAFGLFSEVIAVMYWHRKWRPWAGTAMLAVHLGIAWVMKIHFPANLFWLVVLSYPWERMLGSCES